MVLGVMDRWRLAVVGVAFIMTVGEGRRDVTGIPDMTIGTDIWTDVLITDLMREGVLIRQVA